MHKADQAMARGQCARQKNQLGQPQGHEVSGVQRESQETVMPCVTGETNPVVLVGTLSSSCAKSGKDSKAGCYQQLGYTKYF